MSDPSLRAYLDRMQADAALLAAHTALPQEPEEWQWESSEDTVDHYTGADKYAPLRAVNGRSVLTDAEGRRWVWPYVSFHVHDVVTLVWGDPPMLVRRRPLPRRWWQLRARWDVQVMPLRPWTDG